MTPDLYSILQVAPEAVPEVISAAYRALSKLNHPDLNLSPSATATMVRLTEAYEVLINPASRMAYDSVRHRQSITRARTEFVMPWGKHAGLSLDEIPLSYIVWLVNKGFDEDIVEAARQELENRRASR